MTHPLVSVTWLAEHLHDDDLIILDASMDNNLSKEEPVSTTDRIIGARFFDLKKVFSDQAHPLPNTIPRPEAFEEGCRQLGINKDSKIVVYDNLGIYTSPRARWLFRLMGHDEVAVLDGGLPAWMREGHPVEPIMEETYERGNFEAHFRPELVKDARYILDHLEDEDMLVLDARSEGRFTGQAPEPREGMKSGHIPNSRNLPYTKVLEDGRYHSKEELKVLFDELGVEDEQLTFSCGSGITACVIMLAGELALDNDMAVYDGSWSEWGQEGKNYPVELSKA